MFRHPMASRICRAPEGPPAGAAAPGQPPAGAPPAGAEHPATAPWAGSRDVWKLGEAGKEQPWYHAVPEEPVRELMKAKNYKNPAELAVAYHNANQMNKLAPDITAVLEGKATPEQEKAFYTKMGRPESPDKYVFKHADGVTPDSNLVKLGQEIFYEMGASPAKAQAAMEKWDKAVMAMNAAQIADEQKQNDTELASLSTKWGADLEVHKAAGLRAVQSLTAKGASPELIAKVEGAIGAAPMVELLAILGKMSGEGDGTTGGGNNNSDPNNVAGMTKEQAQARIKQLEGDTEFYDKKYKDKNHPEHKAALTLMEQLFAKAG